MKEFQLDMHVRFRAEYSGRLLKKETVEPGSEPDVRNGKKFSELRFLGQTVLSCQTMYIEIRYSPDSY